MVITPVRIFQAALIPMVVATFLSLPSSLEFGYPAPLRQGLLGMNLSAAQNTDFFVFFHLVETSRDKDSENRIVAIFKPSSPAFRKFVTFRAPLGSQDRIVQTELDLARAFIDSGEERTFANDIAASLLAATPPEEDRLTISTLINEVRQTRPSSGMPAQESPGYLTYVGKRKAYAQELSVSTLHMENTKQENED